MCFTRSVFTIACLVLIAFAPPAFSLSGPMYPPPGGVSFSDYGTDGGGQQALAGGRTFTYQNFEFRAFRALYFAPDPSTLYAQMNGSTAVNLSYSAGSSNLPAGVAVWSGTSTEYWYSSCGFPTAPCSATLTSSTMDVRVTMTVTDFASAPLALTDGASVGLSGAVLKVTGGFRVNALFEARQTGGGAFQPLRTMYDSYAGFAYHRSSTDARTNFDGVFWADLTPLIASVTPNVGATTGGQSVVITGTNLGGATSVTFGGTPGTIIGNTGVSIVAITPGHAAGTVGVAASSANGTATYAGGYTFVASPACLDFGDAVSFTAGTGTSFVTAGDFNGDGNLDLAGADASANSVGILLGSGTGAFAAAVSYSTGAWPVSIATGDFDHDGDQDLVTANYSSHNVSILPGTGTGTFGAAVNYATGTSPWSVATGDFNRDGHLDLAVANNGSDSVSILLGTGTGTFGAAVHYATGTWPKSVVVGDFDRDGRQDLATANSNSNNVSILLGTGTGSFAAAVSYAAGTAPQSMTVADLDGDLDQDLAVANAGSDNVSILLGSGTGTFAAGADYATGGNPVSIAVGDFDGDGDRDLVTSNYDDGNVSILLGSGTGTFAAAVNHAVGTASQSVALGDYNGNGRQDLAVGNTNSSVGYVSILLNGCFPTISDVAPAIGTIAGGQSVTIAGTHLDGATSVTFGGTAAAITGNTATSITVTTPAHAVGLVDIVVTTPEGAVTATNSYRYNTPPVANAGGTYFTDLGDGIALSGAGSSDPDGDSIVSYSWLVAGSIGLSGSSPSLSPAQVSALGAGSHTVSLTVTDFFGLTGSAGTTLTIYDNRPTASFTANPNPAACNQSVAFNASASSHGRPDRAIIVYDWNFGDTTTGSGVNGSHAYSAFGTYTVTLTVTDNNVPPKTDTETVIVNVNQGNSAPTAAPGGPYTADLGSGVALDGSSSSDPDAACGDSIVSFTWLVGGSVGLSGATPSLTAAQVNALGVGSHSVSLTVADEFNATGTVGTTLNVTAHADLTIAKTHAGNFTQGDTGDTYTITVTNSGTGPTTGTVTVIDTLPASLTATDLAGTGWGCTLATLTCTRADALGVGASYDSLTLTVNVAGNAPASVTNTATVSGGGEVNTSNDTANDVTTISQKPRIASMTPNTGPIAGAQTVVITGTHLDGATSVTFGGTAATLGANTATSITVTTPAHAAGAVDVVVTTAGGTATASRGYTYVAATACLDFGAALISGTGTYPVFGVVGDFNGDGHQDLAVANYASNNLSILIGNGTGAFATAVNYGVGATPFAIAAGDFNGDPYLDLAVANGASSNVTILLGTGTGTFTAAGNSGAGTGPRSVAAGDFNGDGHQDLAVANYYSGNVTILLGSGTGTFAPAVGYATGLNAHSVAVGDFNSDGHQDLAVANKGSNNVSILLGSGTGTFAGAVNYPAGSGSRFVVIGDFNSDGDQDLAVANEWASSVSVLLGSGLGTFSAAVEYAAGLNSYSVHIGDLDGDGDQDLAAVNASSRDVSILLGNGLGVFAPAVNFPTGGDPYGMVVADLDEDGHQDLAVTNYPSSVLVFPNGCFPAISNVAPNLGPTAGGQSVTITGKHLEGATSVTFGGAAGNITGNTTTSITVTSPAHAAGLVDVVATTPEGTVTGTNSYRFNTPPVANAGGAYFTDLGDGIALSGAGSSDPDGDSIVSYSWLVGGSIGLSGVSPSLSPAQVSTLGVGSHTVSLTVTDFFGSTGSAGTTLSIYDNQPTASFTANPNPSACNQSVAFNASASSHGRPDRAIVAYDWNFGDSTTGSGMNVSHAFTAFGNYTVTLTVTDNNVPPRTDTETHVVNVNQGNQPPVASPGGPYATGVGSGVTLSGTGSSDPDASCGDAIASYSWMIAGSISLSGSSPSLTPAQVSALGPGAHTVSLTVTDTLGATGTATTTLNVNGAPTITAGTAASRTAGSAGSLATIGTVSDFEDAAGALTVTATSVPPAISITNIINTNGTITATVTAECAAATGSNIITLQVEDSGHLTTTAAFTVDVTANPAPTLGTYGSFVVVSSTGSYSTSSTPTAPPADNVLVTSVTAEATAGFTGTLSGNPTTGVITITNANFGSHTITVTATDNCGATAVTSFVMTIQATPPTITPGEAVSRTAGSAGAIATIATVSDDRDLPGALIVTANSVPAGLSITNITNTTGTVTATVTASCSAATGPNNVTLYVTNSELLQAVATFVVNVAANPAPTLGSYPSTTINPGGATVTPGAAPADNGSVATVTAAASTGFTGTLSGDPATGVITITDANPGTYTVTVTATDNCGATSTGTFALTVNQPNRPPVANAQSVTTSEGLSVAITLTGSDPDDDPLSFDVATSPTKGSLSGTEPNLVYTPNTGQTGSDSFTFTAYDGALTSDPATVSITIDSVGPPATGGTHYLVKDINASGNSSPSFISAMSDGRAVFSAEEPAGGNEPWVSDGTTSGTARLKDIEPNGTSSTPSDFMTRGWTFFNATTSGAGAEPWKSDGTGDGTVMLKDIHGTGSSSPSFFTASGGAIFFAANDGTHGTELWTSNGSEAGTAMVSDIHPSSSSPGELTDVGGTLFFAATDPSFGRELWKSDGGGTSMVKDIESLGGSSSPRNMSNVNGTLFFTADVGGADELWASNGTSGGTYRVEDINPSGGDGVSLVVPAGSIGLFRANDGAVGSELWKTDGSEGGTARVLDIHSGSGNGIASFTRNNTAVIGSTLFFAASDGVHGVELWKSNGTEAGTMMVKDLCPGDCGSNPDLMVVLGSRIYFRATNPYVGEEIWVSDGTSAGTLLAGDVESGSVGSTPESLAAIGNLVYFAATTTATGRELHAVCTTDTTNLGVSGPATSISGASISIVVRPRDGSNALVPCYSGTVHLTSTDGSATLPADHAYTIGEGMHTFEVTLRSLGSRTITATDTVTGSIVGSISITVGASPVTSTIVANPTSIIADGTSTSTITVQLKDAGGTNLTTGGGIVVLETTAGALSPPVNNNDGTYTATLTAPATVGTATISGTLDGVAMTSTATVALKGNTTTSVGSSTNPSAVGQSVTLTATVTSGSAGTISGTVTFKDGATTIGTETISGGSASMSTSSLGLGSHEITATYGGDTNFNSSTSNALTQTVNGVFGAPSNFTATATSTSNVALSWGAVGEATSYEVYRSSLHGPYNFVFATGATTANDTTVSGGVTYLYEVRALRASGASPFSAVDAATTIIFTDASLTEVRVKAAHITELRTAVNAMRAAAGLPATTFTDESLTGLPIRALHITELRTALDAARSVIGLTALVYTNPTIVAGSTTMKAAHITEPRAGTQ